MTSIREDFKKHFNEPVLTSDGIGRVIGYGEDDCDCYLIIQYMRDREFFPEGKITWHTAVGGYYWLNLLKKQGIVHANNGEIWNDFTRLDSLLELNGAPKREKFIMERYDSDGKKTGINPQD